MSHAETPVWRQLALSGTSLIEASAGTGKTWNIALLYLRLVLERKLGAREILVTTFTDAAAQELRARIRGRLLDAERMLSTGTLEDSDIGRFLAECCAAEGQTRVRTRLLLALADIDLAPISTIHGFCRRVLSDFPFDTGVPFTLGEIVDEGTLIRDCVEDFWRGRYLRDAIDPIETALVVPAGPEPLAHRVSRLLSVSADASANGDADGLRRWWMRLCSVQLEDLRQVVDAAQLYARSNSALRTQLRSLLRAAETGDPAGVDWKKLGDALEPQALRKYGHASLTTPLDSHPLLGAWAPLAHSIRLADQIVPADVAQHCARFVESELNRRLRAQGTTTFNQLISEVHDRLTGPDGARLSARLREAWPVALIDEFQDTDTRQWQIFDRIYRPSEDLAETALILIGDPKQSIYAFRGADVHAYLAARDRLQAERRYSIRQNFRSHPRLLDALNGLYQLAGDQGFGGQQIRYVPVSSGRPEAYAPGHSHPGLRLRLLQCAQTSLAERDPIALNACADDIAALLADPDSGVTPGDIAVLIDSNQRVEQMRALLIERGVPVVGSGRSSVLATDWADDLQLLLGALLQPNDEYAVRGALATRLLGATARDLTELATHVPAWDAMLDQFARWRRMWDRRGVLAVVEAVILQQAPRLLARADGERALTDLRHLGELLQDAATECYGPEELYAWFVGERSASAGSIEAGREQQLRIESEARRVQLMTIHASKGLEYPVVYIPMAWRAASEHHRSVDKGLARHHDAEHRLCLDLGTADFAAHKIAEREEKLQERLRTLYVALTRAQTECIAYAFEDTAPRAEASEPNRGALDTLLGAALQAAHALSPDSATPWEALAKAVTGLRIDPQPSAPRRHGGGAPTPPTRLARAPLPAARPYHGIYSYTGLTRLGATPAVDVPQWAEDEPVSAADSLPVVASDDLPDPRITVLARIKGPRFGNVMHQLLEAGRAADAMARIAETPFARQIERIAAALDQESVSLTPGAEAEQLSAMAELLDRTLDTPLAPGLRLADLAPTARKPEFEFAFAIDEGRWHAVHRILDAQGLGHWWPASTEQRVLRGLMTGSMDLVFAWEGRYHVLDYKTNWLGSGCVSDYGSEALDAAMAEHHYGLQALIYTVALHRYLAHRLLDYDPDVHLGESWYLFIRAIGVSPTAGIWRKRFPRALIEAFDALFEGQELAA